MTDAIQKYVEVQFTHAYTGADPDWTGAQGVALPAGITEYTLPALPATKYAVRTRWIDQWGNAGEWSDVAEHTTLAGDDSLSGIAAQATANTALANAAAAQDTADAAATAASAAAAAAATAQTTADGRNTVFYQDATPTANATGDLWFDTDGDNAPYQWNGATWVAFTFGNSAIFSNIDAGKLTVGTLDALRIAAGSISADRFAATLLLASLIRTAATGKRVEIDQNGIRLYDTGGALLVRIPTNADPVYINAQVDAASLTTHGTASFQGATNEFTTGTVTTLRSGQSNPAAGPVLTQGWDTIPLGGADGPYRSPQYSASGGVGGATKVFYAPKTSNVLALGEYLASSGALNRTLDCSSKFDTNVVMGAPHGTSIYVLGQLAGSWRVSKYTITTLAWVADYNAVDFPWTPTMPMIASDGANLFIADINSSSNIVWNKYDASMVKVGGTVDTGYAPGTGTGLVRGLVVGNADIGAWRAFVVTDYAPTATSFNSTGAHQANEDFPVPWDGVTGGAMGLTYGDAAGDGARFWTHGARYDTMLYKHTTWAWTSASSIYWVAYSWYDGSSHETQCGPRSSITMGRRARMDITITTMPQPNARIYMLPNASDPGLTNLKRQATVTSVWTSLRTYDAAGAADPASNNFAAGTPASLKSAVSGWELRGDGTSPGLPPTGSIIMYAGTAAPLGYLFCDGSSLLRASYPALFAVLGTVYGAADGTHFSLPDLRTRFPLGAIAGLDLSETGGAINHTHSQPTHTHTVGPVAAANMAPSNYLVGGVSTQRTATAGTAGALVTALLSPGNTAMNSSPHGDDATGANNPPYIKLMFIIKL